MSLLVLSSDRPERLHRCKRPGARRHLGARLGTQPYRCRRARACHARRKSRCPGRSRTQSAPYGPARVGNILGPAQPACEGDPTADQVKDVAQYIEPKDAHVVAEAIAAGVPYLVSYDRRHLLGEAELIRQRWAIEVVTPDVLVTLVASQ